MCLQGSEKLFNVVSGTDFEVKGVELFEGEGTRLHFVVL